LECNYRLSGFFRRGYCNSCILNLKKGISYSNKKAQVGGKELPVGISFEKEVKGIFGILK
jgi:hypothetical protein